MTEQAETTKAPTTETKICLICHKAVNGSLSRCPEDGGELYSTAQDKLIGEVFANRYKILSIVGQGGMSTVYKAQHTYMDRIVAVKLLHPHLVKDPISVQRFQQEAKAAASLSHPNIITVYDFGVTEEGLAFLVMDYLEGPSLGDLLDRTGPVPPDESLDIFRQILKGLCHAHRKGVVHRDLKPRNMVLAVDEDGTVQVKIVDFGIAKVIPQDGGESQHLTQTGEVFGSPIYMSPEQCSGLPLDARSDLYSLGCVMFEVLAGAPPFLGKNAVETMSMHVNEPPPDIKQIAPSTNVPKELQDVIFGCLEKEQKKRFQTASQVLDALPMPGGQPRVTQTGTVVMKLSDMVQATTTAGPSQGRSKTPRKTKKHLVKISSKTLATTFGVALVFLIGLMVAFPFTNEEDPGSPLQKMYWQFEIWLSDYMMSKQWPGVANAILDQALEDAKKMKSKSKRGNYDVLVLTLSKQADCYLALGKATEQEQVIDEIVRLDRDRYEFLAKQILDEIYQANVYFNELQKKGEPWMKHASDSRLNWAGSTRRIVEVARRLDANYAYVREYELLDQARKLLILLYGPKFIGLADIYEQMADCLLNQDRTAEIADLRLYENIRDIRLDHATRGNPSSGLQVKDPLYVRGELHLGQWQRDRGNFADAEKSLTSALNHAKSCHEVGPEQLSEYYGSYADLLRQTNRTAEADVYAAKAAELRKQAKNILMKDLKRNNYAKHK